MSNSHSCRRAVALSVALAVSLVEAPDAAAVATATGAGIRITDPNGGPVAQATVKITFNGQTTTAKTDDDGVVAIAFGNPGTAPQGSVVLPGDGSGTISYSGGPAGGEAFTVRGGVITMATSTVGTRAGKGMNKKHVIGGGAGLLLLGAIALSGGNDATAGTSTLVAPPVAAPTPAPTPTPDTSPITVNGNYRVSARLASDPPGQAPSLALPSEIVLTFSASGGNLEVTCPPWSRWIPTNGMFDAVAGRFTTFGVGPLAGRDRAARLEGAVDRTGQLRGATYSIEFGSLSTVYTVEGSRQ